MAKFVSEPCVIQQNKFIKHQRPVKAYNLIIVNLPLQMTSSPQKHKEEQQSEIPKQ